MSNLSTCWFFQFIGRVILGNVAHRSGRPGYSVSDEVQFLPDMEIVRAVFGEFFSVASFCCLDCRCASFFCSVVVPFLFFYFPSADCKGPTFWVFCVQIFIGFWSAFVVLLVLDPFLCPSLFCFSARVLVGFRPASSFFRQFFSFLWRQLLTFSFLLPLPLSFF